MNDFCKLCAKAELDDEQEELVREFVKDVINELFKISIRIGSCVYIKDSDFTRTLEKIGLVEEG